MNETTAEIQTLPAAESLAMRQLHHVGAAYCLIFVLLLVFVWRTTAAVKRLGERVNELERDGGQSR